MNKFGGWLAGVFATIIGGYAVWYFTRPPSTTILEGMVYATSSAVPKAMVSLELTGSGANGGTFRNVTNENGSYRFDFTGSLKPQARLFAWSPPDFANPRLSYFRTLWGRLPTWIFH